MKILTDNDQSFLNYDYYKSAKFSPDGRYVAASHYDGAVRIWHVRLGRLVRRVRAHVDLVNDIAFMPDGKGLISGGRDMTLRYWDVGFLKARFDARSDVEEQIRVERQFSGHEVRRDLLAFFYSSPFPLIAYRILCTPLPSLLMEDGSLLARTTRVSGSGTFVLRRWNISSTLSPTMRTER
jgi:WD40 repeat protein